MGLKVSDVFTMPLCRGHHRQLHQAGDEAAWWDNLKINALHIAKGLWQESRLRAPTTVAQASGEQSRSTSPLENAKLPDKP